MLFQGAVFGQAPIEAPATRQWAPHSLRCANAVEVAKKLTAALGGGAQIVADEETNTVFIRASADKVHRAKEILQRLDDDIPSCLYMIPLRNADAADTANTLGTVLRLLRLFGDDREAYVAVDGRNNAIIVSACESKAEEVREMISRCDVKPE